MVQASYKQSFAVGKQPRQVPPFGYPLPNSKIMYAGMDRTDNRFVRIDIHKNPRNWLNVLKNSIVLYAERIINDILQKILKSSFLSYVADSHALRFQFTDIHISGIL
jgi:hypothetical protein